MWFFILAAVLFLLDRTGKYLARQGKLPTSLLDGRIVLTHWENRGMAGGVCKDNKYLSSILPCLCYAVVLLCFIPHFVQRNVLSKAGIALFTAGGLSNIYDRIRRGSVTDYIRFPRLPLQKLKRLVWNIADFMIILGAILAAIGILKESK